MSHDYIEKQWENSPDTLYGIGKYGSDAYRIFCAGDWQSVEPKDHALNDYHSVTSEEPGQSRTHQFSEKTANLLVYIHSQHFK